METISYIAILGALIASLITAAVMLPWLLHFCHKHGLYDVPNERKMHKNNIPRLGGTIFLPCMVAGGGIGILISNVMGYPIQEIQVSTVAIMVGTVTIFFTGLFDDIFGMKARYKFAVQFIAAAIMPLCGLYVNDLQGVLGLYDIPALFAYPLTVFLVMLVVNSYNLIDGIDGLSASLSIVALSGLGWLFFDAHVWAYTIMSLSLVAALLVFLYFNIWGKCERRTKTFMGDSGSLILGYTISFLGLKFAMENPVVIVHRPYAVLAAFTVLVIPTFDLVRVALTRLFQGKPMFGADKQHIHHRFADAGFTTHQTLVAIVALQLLYCILNAALYCAAWDINLIIATDIALFTAVQLWLSWRMYRRGLN